MIRSVRPFVAVLAASLVVAGCSSSTSGSGSVGGFGKGSASSSGGGFPASSSDTGSASSGGGGSAPSQTVLQGIVLQAGDLDSSWTGKPGNDNSGSSDISGPLATCLGVDPSSLGPARIDRVVSESFQRGDSQVSSYASSYASQDSIDKRLAVLTGPKAEQCLSQSFKDELAKSLPAGAQVGDLTVKIDRQPTGLPSSVKAVTSATASLSVPSGPASMQLRIAFIVGHLVTVTVQYFSVNTPIDDAVWTKAVTAVGTRAAAA